MSSRPRLLLVVGVGRSGTSAFTGAVAALGYAVPQPEIGSGPTNPRGFGEPRWAVEFQGDVLRSARVGNFDARPYAWRLTREAGERTETVDALRNWLSEQFEQHDRVVVKDPRTAWLLPLWKRVSRDLGLDTAYVTMLRPPAEVVASASRWYGGSRHQTSRLGGWANVLLRTERATRDTDRGFVRYSDLLADWRAALGRADSSLGLQLGLQDRGACEQVDAWLDPGLRREQKTLDDMDAPGPVRAIAEAVWTELDAAVEVDDAALHQRLDQLRADYRRLYLDAERIAHSSIVAAGSRGQDGESGSDPPEPATAGADSQPDDAPVST